MVRISDMRCLQLVAIDKFGFRCGRLYHARFRICDPLRKAAMLYFIFIGFERRNWSAECGKFHCRICRGERGYTLINSCIYFTVFFIPICPVDEMDEVVECHDCGRRFEVDALSYKPPPGPKERLLERVSAELAAGKSAEEVQERMVYPGLSSDDIGQAIRSRLPEMWRRPAGRLITKNWTKK